MRLGWNRAEDGVITVYAHASDGRSSPVADFWVQPLIDRFGMNRADAKEWQQQFAEMLVNAHNRHFSPAPPGADGLPADLRIANAIRAEINQILARYDIYSDVYERDLEIDGACVRLADQALRQTR